MDCGCVWGGELVVCCAVLWIVWGVVCVGVETCVTVTVCVKSDCDCLCEEEEEEEEKEERGPGRRRSGR